MRRHLSFKWECQSVQQLVLPYIFTEGPLNLLLLLSSYLPYTLPFNNITFTQANSMFDFCNCKIFSIDFRLTFLSPIHKSENYFPIFPKLSVELPQVAYQNLPDIISEFPLSDNTTLQIWIRYWWNSIPYRIMYFSTFLDIHPNLKCTQSVPIFARMLKFKI